MRQQFQAQFWQKKYFLVFGTKFPSVVKKNQQNLVCRATLLNMFYLCAVQRHKKWVYPFSCSGEGHLPLEENLWECFSHLRWLQGFLEASEGWTSAQNGIFLLELTPWRDRASPALFLSWARVSHHQGGVLVTLKLSQAGHVTWPLVRVPPSTHHGHKPCTSQGTPWGWQNPLKMNPKPSQGLNQATDQWVPH